MKDEKVRFQVNSFGDPTYDKEKINADPVWQLAWSLSEIENDNAPIGWVKYITTARCLLDNYNIKRKEGR